MIQSMISYSGYKLRKDAPGTLKDIINDIKTYSEEVRRKKVTQDKKIEFLLDDLENLKLNKIQKDDTGDRILFLKNWLKKNVIAK